MTKNNIHFIFVTVNLKKTNYYHTITSINLKTIILKIFFLHHFVPSTANPRETLLI